MNRFPKLGPLLVGAFAVACDQPTQPTQPTVNQPQVETAKVGRWGAVPSGPTVNARLEPRSNAVAPGVRAVGVTALVVTAGEFANGSFETGLPHLGDLGHRDQRPDHQSWAVGLRFL